MAYFTWKDQSALIQLVLQEQQRVSKHSASPACDSSYWEDSQRAATAVGLQPWTKCKLAGTGLLSWRSQSTKQPFWRQLLESEQQTLRAWQAP